MAIDDARLHLLAHSPHRGEVDPVRAESILRRAVPTAIVDHVYASRDEATGRYLVSPRPDLGLTDERIGVPILHQGSLLGFVWLLGSEGPTEPVHLDAVEQTAAHAAILIHREHLRVGSARERIGELIGQVFSEDEGERSAAAGAIRAESLFTAPSFAVIAAEIDRHDEHGTGEDQLALASGLAAMRSRRLPHDLLTLERQGLVLLVVAEALTDDRTGIRVLADSLRDAILAKTDGAQCWVGISRRHSDLVDAAVAAEEAQRAVRAIRRVHAFGEVATVESLGVYELLDQVPDAALAATTTLDSAAHRERLAGSTPSCRRWRSSSTVRGTCARPPNSCSRTCTSLDYRLLPYPGAHRPRSLQRRRSAHRPPRAADRAPHGRRRLTVFDTCRKLATSGATPRR